MSELLRFRSSAGAAIEAPEEWAPAVVEICLPVEQRHQAHLARNGVGMPTVLQTIGGAERITADWPRSGTGRYWLSLQHPGGLDEARVTVVPRKISGPAFGRLLEDLEHRLPAAVAVGLQRTGALAGAKLLPPDQATRAQELQRLRHAVLGTPVRVGLAAALSALANTPHHMLHSSGRWVRAEDARRPDPLRLVRVLAEGRQLDGSGYPERVLDVRVQHTVDVYENRLVRLFHDTLAQRLRRFARSLERDVAAGAFWGNESATALQTEVTNLVRTLSRARRAAGFLGEVSVPTTPPDRATMVLIRRPPYRAAYEGYLDFIRYAWVDLDEPALDAPLENLPYLYQLWCTLELVDSLLDVSAELGYRVQHQRLVAPDRDGYSVRVLPDGQPVLRLEHGGHKTRVVLTPERTYSPGGAGLMSLSFAQRPDVALEVYQPDAPPRVWLFDPKYKLDSEFLVGPEAGEGQPKKFDIDKMHTYRDAIRGAGGDPVVQYAAILYPGPRVGYPGGSKPCLEALHAYPGSALSLRDQVREVLIEALTPR